MRFDFPKLLAFIHAQFRPLAVSFVVAWMAMMITNPDSAVYDGDTGLVAALDIEAHEQHRVGACAATAGYGTDDWRAARSRIGC